jgi:excisionase family DNA binding protein
LRRNLLLTSDTNAPTPKANAATTRNEKELQARDAGVEPTTFGFGGSASALSDVSSASQTLANIESRDRGPVQPSQPLAEKSKDFVTRLLPDFPDGAPVEQRFFSVREVATILGVKPVTIYRLVAAGKLPHVRVANAIRIAFSGAGR